jgi:hypothetical protein
MQETVYQRLRLLPGAEGSQEDVEVVQNGIQLILLLAVTLVST